MIGERFYTYKKSQGSQTQLYGSESEQQFYTYKKSQGSQTAYLYP